MSLSSLGVPIRTSDILYLAAESARDEMRHAIPQRNRTNRIQPGAGTVHPMCFEDDTDDERQSLREGSLDAAAPKHTLRRRMSQPYIAAKKSLKNAKRNARFAKDLMFTKDYLHSLGA